jgi:hypothetical protein
MSALCHICCLALSDWSCGIASAGGVIGREIESRNHILSHFMHLAIPPLTPVTNVYVCNALFNHRANGLLVYP